LQIEVCPQCRTSILGMAKAMQISRDKIHMQIKLEVFQFLLL
jgi:hypothetical protein